VKAKVLEFFRFEKILFFSEKRRNVPTFEKQQGSKDSA